MPVEIPAAYRAMPRWWAATAPDRAWLAALPATVDAWCDRWSLALDGPVSHGSHALVVPVRADGSASVLRLSPPSQDVGPLAAALAFWREHGAVELLRTDRTAGVLLLERLGPATLAHEPLGLAVGEIGRVARRLAVPVPADVAAGLPQTSDVVRERTPALRTAWSRLGRPFRERFLAAAEAAAAAILTGRRELVAVNGDLHYAQVLRGSDGGWRVVDPVLLAGDAERTAVDVLWHRVDEMSDAEIPRWFAALVGAAALDPELAPAWAVWRVTDYWLWGLEHGLTEDPARCHRLATALGA
ncbi:aminoglycoside phosphotransferase family protein [Xylanimonas sp. McL0601]|uniref:aminoglycoside phosphotransferase family protein n=1 Tax=Xylanimonas sp. McL0601 TaxID=3414739 RepID=UPI003CFAD156